ncbi:MAG TPA: hypothetical protein VM030_02220 [Acidimicrobiales bacterium]|nr:hypothetical protein [Acidimicrobiales bacterium]
MDPERRSALLQSKLRALVVATRALTRPEVSAAAPGAIRGGATLVAGATGFVLAEDDPARALGPAMTWGARGSVEELHVLALAEAAPDLARRAALFAEPPSVWAVDGTSVEMAAPRPFPTDPALPADVAAFSVVIEAAGAEAVVEQGVLRAEVLGLEVGRVVVGDDGPVLEVGVGKHDRWAHAELASPMGLLDELRAAVDEVRTRRVADGLHQLARLTPERWLRSVVMARPELAGAASLAAIPSPVARPDLRTTAPAPAMGVDATGRPVVVVCSVGIDLDLVPAGADMAVFHEARLVLVVPEGDDHPLNRQLSGRLAAPAEWRTVGPDWAALYPG